jgi:succinate-semialdehyde dehydrogenase/glutarate-semialdehyde dehydrogenase
MTAGNGVLVGASPARTAPVTQATGEPAANTILRERAAPLLRGLTDIIPLADRDRAQTPVRAPFTNEVIGSVPSCTAADVQYAAAIARQAQAEWARRPLAERRKIMLRFHDLVLDRQEQLLDLGQIEGGKARRNVVEEVYDIAINARHYAFHADEYLRPRRRHTVLLFLTHVMEYRHPIGVVGIISPWNYPLTMAVSDAIPALLAGNAVILKPAELTPFSALYLALLLYEAGLPAGLLQVVTGRGREIGTPLIEASDFIGFTGSTATGRLIGSQAGQKLIKSSLELGGKNPMIVLDDADLDRTTHGAIQGCFPSAGQLCVSFERLYIQSGIYDQFVEGFVRRTNALRLGPQLDYSVDVGSLIGKEQLDKTVEHLEDALAKGATLLTGGRCRPDLGPYFMEPTILTDVTPEMMCYHEETFGPVVSIYKFETVEDAIRQANESVFGLSASVWTHDLRRGFEIAREIQCGTVNVNEAYHAAWAAHAPMGGMKDSGLGRRHGDEGFTKYTESQTVAAATLGPLFPPFGIDMGLTAELFPKLLKAIKYVPGWR